jgi:hypothetical protein
MKSADPHHRHVRWSDEDQAYIGYCLDLYFGGVCHGEDEAAVYAELCGLVRDEIEHRLAKGEALPEPRVRAMSELTVA